MIHGENDSDIQIFHSENLFFAVLEPNLEQYPFTKKEMAKINLENDEQRQIVAEISGRRRQQRASMIKESDIHALGKLLKFSREGKGDVAFLRSTWGGHDKIINYEGVMDVTRKLFEL